MMSRRSPAIRLPLQPALLLLLSLAIPARAQTPSEPWPALLARVVPAAQRFSDRRGDPPAFEAFRTDAATGVETLIGYAFVTSDLPPEEKGFDAPIQVLVGMDLEGALTGVVVLDYRESLRSSRGDFLARAGFQEQYAGKGINDAFRVKRDVEGITGATITVGAMSRGIRNAARRMALARGVGSVSAAAGAPLLDAATVRADQLEPLSWAQILVRGLVQQLTVLDRGRAAATLTFFYLRDASVGEVLMGPGTFAEAVNRAGARASGRHMFLLGADGPLAGGLNLERLSVVQGGDTLRVGADDIFIFGPPVAGKVDGQLQFMRVVLLDGALDLSRPFRYELDLRPALSVFTADYPGVRAVATAAAGASAGAGRAGAAAPPGATISPPGSGAGATSTLPLTTASPSVPTSTSETTPSVPPTSATVESSASPEPSDADPQILDIGFEEQESLLARTLGETSWARVAGLLVVLALATAAFVTKRPPLRWVSLGATVLFLGVVDKGFLSVSHLTSGLKVGPSVYLADLSLFVLVAFTVVTTLLWGRVFCGYLCPFGALQDFLEWVVPKRFRRELSARVHQKAALAKYGVLAVVIASALIGGGVVIYQYVEPFGTVFFPSRSLLLWGIAAGLLAASAIVPRFYCRYVCPLGAALALGSLLAPFRIKRVEQCTVCKVCEQRCPTRAIQLERIDFKECVRCNVCEVKLIEKAGVCRHDMTEVRSRLVKLEAPGATR
jgi:NAD-dependent dihydropyrimidine dehydrogenase PreA subunit/Flp pilus assembly pilin Flp